jgi:hypothetical protein
VESLHERIRLLCEELEIPAPPESGDGSYEVIVDQVKIQFRSLADGSVVMTASLGRLNTMAGQLDEQASVLLARCLHLHGARLSGLGLPFAFSIEPESDEMILWVPVLPEPGIGTRFRQELEDLLNEVEFRRNWLGLTTDSP